MSSQWNAVEKEDAREQRARQQEREAEWKPLVIIAIGILNAFLAWLGYTLGELREGRIFRRTVNREDNPLAFYFWLAVHCVIGVACILWGIFIWLGVAKPMPWR